MMLDLLMLMMIVVLVALVAVWGYNRYTRISKFIEARRTIGEAPALGEISSPEHRQRAEGYAETLTPQAEEAAERLLKAVDPEVVTSGWATAGADIYRRVAYRVPADNNWRQSVSAMVREIGAVVDSRYPTDERLAAEFAAFLAAVGAEAFGFMLPSSGGEAAWRLMAGVGGE